MVTHFRVIIATLWLGSGGVVDLAAEDRVAWLRDNVLPIQSLDAHRADSTDLRPLSRYFADTDLVLLGEATRGDGSTFEAKTRLVRFLHEQLGFDVLVFECGFFDCHLAWQQMRNGRSSREALGEVLFPLYVDSQQFQALLDLLDQGARSQRPLEVAGIDSQLSASALQPLQDGLNETLATCGDLTEPAGDLESTWEVLRHVADGSYSSGLIPLPDDQERRRIDNQLDRFLEVLKCPDGGKDLAFWRQVVVNLQGALELTWELGHWNPRQTMSPEIHNLRDAQMAENLLWWRRQGGSGRKTIVWSLTLHLARRLADLETGEMATAERFRRFELLGERLSSELEPDPYVVAFTAFQGRKGSIFQRPHALLVPTRGSLEDLMGQTELESAFLDLQSLRRLEGGKWLNRPLIARPIAFKELRGLWPRHVDAFFFVRTMQAARRQSQ